MNKEKLIFIHIPKTAGTSIKKLFLNDNDFSLLTNLKKHEPIYNIKKNNINDYNKYKKFAIVRNPYDRIVSSYFFLQKMNIKNFFQTIEFNEWIKNPCKHPCKLLPGLTKYLLLAPQYLWIDETVNILKYENLNKELNTFLNKKVNLPKINNSIHEHYLNYYNNKSLNIIYHRYKEDFKKFNYKKL
jgi:chondroitin 4-sulfotransferase 11